MAEEVSEQVLYGNEGGMEISGGRGVARVGGDWGRTGRGWRCGTAELRVVQEDGAGAKMSVQVRLFIALHHGPF